MIYPIRSYVPIVKSDPIIIEINGILIRGLQDTDLNALTAMRNDTRIYRYEPSFLAELQGKPEDSLNAIRSMDLNRDRQSIFGIYEGSSPETLAGLAEFYDYKPSGKVISIGYRLRPEFWGRGIGFRCAGALLDYLRCNTEVELVTAHVIPGNTASSRILLKHGFERLLTKLEDWGYGEPVLAEVYTCDLLR